MDPAEMIEQILEWATENDDFDTSFVEDLNDKLERGMTLTDSQITALENIITRWNI